MGFLDLEKGCLRGDLSDIFNYVNAGDSENGEAVGNENRQGPQYSVGVVELWNQHPAENQPWDFEKPSEQLDANFSETEINEKDGCSHVQRRDKKQYSY